MRNAGGAKNFRRSAAGTKNRRRSAADKSLNDKPAEAPKWIVVLNDLTFTAGILMITANFFYQ